MRAEDVKTLEGYCTFPEAAEILGMTKQGIHSMVFDFDQFRSIRKVGSRPFYVLKLAEVQEKKAARDAAAAERAKNKVG